MLLGPYSRFSWFHPGPLLYYVLWLPYRITGSTGASLAIAALTLNAVVVVGIALVARRRGGLPLVLLTLFLVGLLSAGEGAQFFRDVWNPLITVLPFVLLVLVAWSMSCAEAWALPVGVVVATFLVQTHVGYGLVATALLLAGVVGAAITAWRRRSDGHHAERVRSWLRMLVVTAGVGAVLWLPSSCNRCATSPATSASSSASSATTVASTATATRGMPSLRSSAPGPTGCAATSFATSTAARLDLSGATPVAVWALVLVVAGVFTWRRAKDAFRLDVVVALTIVVAVVSVSRIVGDIFPYLVTWTWAVGMLTWLAIAWSVVRWWQTRGASDPRVGQVALGVVAVGLVVVSIVNTVDAATAGNPDPIGSRQVKGLVAKIRDALPSGDGVVEIRGGTTPGSAWVGSGIAAQLEHDGIDTPRVARPRLRLRTRPRPRRRAGAPRGAPGRATRLRRHPRAPVLRGRRPGREVHPVPRRSRAASIEDEVDFPVAGVGELGLVALAEDAVLEHQRVHLGAHEAAVGVLGRAHDRLAAHVERRVDHDRATGEPVERLDDGVELGAVVARDGLEPRGVVDVRDRRDRGAHLVHPRAQIGAALVVVRVLDAQLGRTSATSSMYGDSMPGSMSKYLLRLVVEHRRRERSERLPVLDLEVHDRLHRGRARVADDRAVRRARGARTPCAPAGADHVAVGDRSRRCVRRAPRR